MLTAERKTHKQQQQQQQHKQQQQHRKQNTTTQTTTTSQTKHNNNNNITNKTQQQQNKQHKQQQQHHKQNTITTQQQQHHKQNNSQHKQQPTQTTTSQTQQQQHHKQNTTTTSQTTQTTTTTTQTTQHQHNNRTEKKVTFQDERKKEAPKDPKAPGADKQEAKTGEGNRKGMLAWIAQGLEKVVPQPDLKVKESAAAERPAEITVTSCIKQGIDKVVPQPEIQVRSKTDGNEKTEAPASTKAEAPPPEAPPAPKPAADTEKSSGEAEQQQPNMMGWIFSGIGRMLPQPVQKQDSGSGEVQSISITQQRTDLVLEDVGPDEDTEATREVNTANLQASRKENEDAETQMDWTPLRDSAKKEAGEAVLAHMEERLQQERLEAARVAEEVARKAAEEAVRQLEVEHSAKIIIETLPESSEQLPNILEEENEDDPECPVDVCPADDDTDAQVDRVGAAAGTVKLPTLPTESELPEEVTPSSTDVEPGSERRDLESPVSQPITQQPQSQAPEARTTTTEQGNKAAEEVGCGVPDLCSPVQSFLLRIPHAADCLESCRKLMHDNYLNPPKLSMPTLPPELALLSQELLQLRNQAQEYIVSRLRRLNFTSQNPQQP
ncbi:hypothetical protein F2P81_004010 [Scophthalmus maximus]|uniref:Uncharacterized protein n=1 Tax=Scophthalmus maximus TaxID=52904 RepID=A0A6A4T9B6_SCOMX|nr:hypothetical protein F2P81_004010 [Scophthalmus maximus]